MSMVPLVVVCYWVAEEAGVMAQPSDAVTLSSAVVEAARGSSWASEALRDESVETAAQAWGLKSPAAARIRSCVFRQSRERT